MRVTDARASRLTLTVEWVALHSALLQVSFVLLKSKGVRFRQVLHSFCQGFEVPYLFLYKGPVGVRGVVVR